MTKKWANTHFFVIVCLNLYYSTGTNMIMDYTNIVINFA